jgi:sodium transport system permease protein
VAIIFVVKFFAGLMMAPPEQGAGAETLAWLVLVPQLCIVVPAIMMALLFTSDPRQTLLLKGWPKPSTIFAAAALAVCYLPVGRQLAVWIMQLYPFDPQTIELLKEFEGLLHSTSFGLLLLFMAVVPAICEELAFRGFVLSGLRHLGHKSWAIVLTAVFFGMAHSAFLQQSLSATAAGVLIGYIALKSGHLAPCITFHFAYNGLSFALAQVDRWLAQHPVFSERLQWFYRPSASELQPFTPVAIMLGGLATAALLWWFHRLDAPQSAEERLTEARRQPIQRPFVQDLS